jgi:hypothetical protein
MKACESLATDNVGAMEDPIARLHELAQMLRGLMVPV